RVVVYAGDVDKTIPVIYQEGVGENNIVTLENVVVSDGTLKMGLKKIAPGSNWHTIQIKSLTLQATKAKADAAAQDAYWTGIAQTVAAYEAYANVAGQEKAAIAAADTKAAAQAAIPPFYAAKGSYDALVEAITNAKAEGIDVAEAEAVLASAETTAEQAAEAVHSVRLAYNTAKATEGADMTYTIINPSFELGNTTGWTYETSNDHGAKRNDNATYTMSGCDGDYLFNIWSSGNAISQTIEDLPNGIYKLQATIATDGGHQVQLNANDKSVKIDAVVKETGVEGELEFQVLDNKATIGAEGVDKYWYKVDNFRLTYVKEINLEELAATYDDILAEAKGITGDMNADDAAALASAIEANGEVDKTDFNALTAAITALTEATTAAKASVAAYAKAADVLPKMKELTESTNVYTEAAYEEYYGQWYQKYEAKEMTTAEADALQDPFVVTGWHASITCDNFLLSAWDTNPDFVDAPYYINTWSVEGESDGSEFKVPFFEYWTGDANSLGEKTLTATMTNLPAGKYDVTALVRVRIKNGAEAPAAGITMQANEGEAVNVCDGTEYTPMYVKEVAATGVVGENGELKIKFIVDAENNISWLSFKNVKFEKQIAAEDIEITVVEGDIAAALAEAKAAVDKVGNITINLAAGANLTLGATIEAPNNLTINGNGATVTVAEEVTDNFITLDGTEDIVTWTDGEEVKTNVDHKYIASVLVKDVTVKGLQGAFIKDNQKTLLENLTIDGSNIQMPAANKNTIDFNGKGYVGKVTVTNSTIWAADKNTGFFAQYGSRPKNINGDWLQEFDIENSTIVNIANGKNVCDVKQNGTAQNVYTLKNNIFVDCGKQNQVVVGFNKGQDSAIPVWDVTGNYFAWGGECVNAAETEKAGKQNEEDIVKNCVDAVIEFTDAANGDFNGTLTLQKDGDEAPASLGSPEWSFSVVTGINSIASDKFANESVYTLSGQKVVKAQKGLYIINGKKQVVK
ncbi:MAG: DUF4957 domain-containing protein, partial [Prevotella sp.]|nr:DUF4957 domain-containing protein [Prevotella sp.]